MRRVSFFASIMVLSLLSLSTACATGGNDSELKEAVIENYANGVHALYARSLASAMEMDSAIDTFLTDPDPATLEAAKRTWLRARDDYGPTEAFRFYGGPIDNELDGPEGLINAWPLDESYIDYVEGNPDAGIINMMEKFPVIDPETLVSLNEQGGEENISTGWHAIEFLLWGQDLSENGPGARPVEDYTSNPNADRRGIYLAVASDLLLRHLQQLVDAWDPNRANNYRAEFLAMNSDEALTNIITGIGELSRGELAGERMTVAYEERSQEDEHSCFSDNTTSDIIANARGIQMVLEGDYGPVSGPGILDLVAAENAELAGQLKLQVASSVNFARQIPAPFDQHLRGSTPDSATGRASVLTTIEALESQTDTIVSASEAVGVTINVS
jgi:putative iron-regulated protein